MSNVVSFKDAKTVREQHKEGEAFCIECDHRWVAVAPTGTIFLECPACRAHKGHFKFGCAPDEGELLYTCGCGNQLFFMTKQGHLCVNCGVYVRYS